MAHKDHILRWLESGKTITPHEAYERWGCMRLGARIYDLKQAGYNIVSVREEGTNRRGEKCHYARYRMGARA